AFPYFRNSYVIRSVLQSIKVRPFKFSPNRKVRISVAFLKVTFEKKQLSNEQSLMKPLKIKFVIWDSLKEDNFQTTLSVSQFSILDFSIVMPDKYACEKVQFVILHKENLESVNEHSLKKLLDRFVASILKFVIFE
ncbi:MAG: hypothetical protein ABI091_05580, partial [Ferruginibacter sp.]